METKRALWSKTLPLLLLLDLTAFRGMGEGDRVLRNVASALFSSTKEIDTKGWHRYPAVLGILVTDLIGASDSLVSTRDAIVDGLRTNLAKTLNSSDLDRILFSSNLAEPLPCFLVAS
jgi:hypothetical protein